MHLSKYIHYGVWICWNTTRLERPVYCDHTHTHTSTGWVSVLWRVRTIILGFCFVLLHVLYTKLGYHSSSCVRLGEELLVFRLGRLKKKGDTQHWLCLQSRAAVSSTYWNVGCGYMLGEVFVSDLCFMQAPLHTSEISGVRVCSTLLL